MTDTGRAAGPFGERSITIPGSTAQVVGDGEQQQIPRPGWVTGDVLVLAEGDIGPADADVVNAAALLADEAALTGESVPADPPAAGRPLGGGLRSYSR